MSEPDIVRTGIAGLDDILDGGIPRGNVILLEGAIGVGKTTMGVEFVYRGASQFGEPGVRLRIWGRRGVCSVTSFMRSWR